MSELRIGLVAALSAILSESPVVVPLQPESKSPKRGGGWCGVVRWCMEVRASGTSTLESDPTFQTLDLVVVQVDADVAHKSYADCRPPIDPVAENLGPLPCFAPCPPPAGTVNALSAVVLTWLGFSALGPQTLLCVPSKAIESWVAAALLSDMPDLAVANIECEQNMEGKLKVLPMDQRIKKNRREYQTHAVPAIKRRWTEVCAHCSQAQRFQQDVETATQQ
jgi:hypothetical protein